MKHPHLGAISNIALIATRGTRVGGTLALLLVLGSLATQWAKAQTLDVLYSFPSASMDGSPYAGLIRDRAGNLYGVTYGGTFCGEPYRTYGSVFKIDPKGNETVLHSFTGIDGACPFGGLIQDSAGNLYGTTYWGGTDYCGVVFKLDPSGTETILHNFTGVGESLDGCGPESHLLRDTAGNLYGTTWMGGTYGVGTVFKIDPSGTETILHYFGADGAYPRGGLIADAQGSLYGLAPRGGPLNNGELYKISSTGMFTILHAFAGSPNDACGAAGTPIRDKDGNFYGTGGCGSSTTGSTTATVWKIGKDGKDTTLLANFGEGPLLWGLMSDDGLIFDPDGNLYGVTFDGGAYDSGTVYKLRPDGVLIPLHSFAGTSNGEGAFPWGRLIRDEDGSLYGTTQAGGSGGLGTVWKLTP